MDINLDEHFRRGEHSKARKVAELLLSGRPYTRQELSTEVDGVAITTVNRVVEILEQAGATVVRELDGRQAVFRVVEVTEPKRRTASPSLDASGQVVRDELIGGAHVVDFITGNQRFRGRYPGVSTIPPVATKVDVVGVEKNGDEVTVMLESDKGKRFRLEYLQNISSK